MSTGEALRLIAYISSGGLHGEIRFEQTAGDSVTVSTALHSTLQYPEQQWEWFVTRFPVDYTRIDDRCSLKYLGDSYVRFY